MQRATKSLSTPVGYQSETSHRADPIAAARFVNLRFLVQGRACNDIHVGDVLQTEGEGGVTVTVEKIVTYHRLIDVTQQNDDWQPDGGLIRLLEIDGR